ncbi:hypothetical protein X777_04214 [Ooceraea biroi]|uniref:Uncharacterized protein n=1 Tax=Ooceraea biroi TaxID=2015173 RepID=A0A026WJ56_OOCBI|nr:hypothetical protein X777_04214 [Ooceraea biroi]
MKRNNTINKKQRLSPAVALKVTSDSALTWRYVKIKERRIREMGRNRRQVVKQKTINNRPAKAARKHTSTSAHLPD